LFTHLFSSHLQRAAKTAGKIREAQLTPAGDDNGAIFVPEVVQLPLLVEQNFGSMEGKKFYERPPESKLTGKEHPRFESKGTAGFVAVESKDHMGKRADTFLDKHLLPLLDDTTGADEQCIAIVSHGIFLSTLWKRLLLRLPAKSVVLSPKLHATARPSLKHLGGWSNTGFLELHMVQSAVGEESSGPAASATSVTSLSPPSAETPVVGEGLGKVEISQVSENNDVAVEAAPEATVPTDEVAIKTPAPRNARGWNTTILAINGKDHLKGMKRTGGGVGSSRHDTSQKSIETFFKRRKTD
jgi:broad specificity phosphatase PhoE